MQAPPARSSRPRRRMRLIRDFPPPAPAAPLALAIGNFDGVHLGHQRLLQRVCRHAAARRLIPAAMSFEPHPLAVLRPAVVAARIGGCADKLRRLRRAGMQHIYLPRFTAALAAMPAPDFAAALFGDMRVDTVIVGDNFRFGHRAKGDFSTLASAARQYGAQAVAAPLFCLDGAPVSSGRVRDHLQKGDFSAAADLLRRDWTLTGRVRRGAGRGREWGFPTANLALSFTPPLSGIYAARARTAAGSVYAAAVSIGVNPTVSADDAIKTEAHLLDFAGDLYGQKLTLRFLQKLRDEQKYPSTEDLIAAIKDDVRQTREIVASNVAKNP